ncbi:predicted protein [Histoplasma capsulatum G186AR]|uniref:Uncharacterized protein n=1 Tax=Ajellomyces capsulatus (strain G186AR / H82 / ATCC MYA-2454 / RMSCC 2432) TaxID=447093 RepID=C0P172_AJECG|nr:uncharacterized protein HCBG_09152 [Histoplasma capsulatum G186AR]EEH02587.1 predicted protein [Histoplasma capsulatum G186AR]
MIKGGAAVTAVTVVNAAGDGGVKREERLAVMLLVVGAGQGQGTNSTGQDEGVASQPTATGGGGEGDGEGGGRREEANSQAEFRLSCLLFVFFSSLLMPIVVPIYRPAVSVEQQQQRQCRLCCRFSPVAVDCANEHFSK